MGCGEPDPMAPGGIRLLTVSGPAGSGKSFLTLAAAWERLERGHFERIILTRPMVDVGASLGFLPGTLEEKISAMIERKRALAADVLQADEPGLSKVFTREELVELLEEPI